MIEYLADKLRAQSITEEEKDTYAVKNEEQSGDHDSGTESDHDEHKVATDMENQPFLYDHQRPSMSDSSDSAAIMESGMQSNSRASSMISASPLDESVVDYELEHSSEEELEVINCNNTPKELRFLASARGMRCGSALPEKRKWSEMDTDSSMDQEANISYGPMCKIPSRPHTRSYTASSNSNTPFFMKSGHSSGSSDDESGVSTPMSEFAPPLKFSKSPPLHAHKPTRRSLSPPVKMLNSNQGVEDMDNTCEANSIFSASRKRHRYINKSNNQARSMPRPCLDFEKMQQMKTDSPITQWATRGPDHSGELSLCCW